MKCEKCNGAGGWRKRINTIHKSLISGQEIPLVSYESVQCDVCKGSGWIMTEQDNPLPPQDDEGNIAGKLHRCKGCGGACFKVELNLCLVCMTCVNCGLRSIVLSEVALLPSWIPVRVGLHHLSEYNEHRYLRLIEESEEK